MAQLTLSLDAIPTPTGFRSVLAGETWYFQAWFRDFTGFGFSNFTDAVEIAFH
ncbi:hypothetical protein Poly30_56210 [Planctomycetes bacterium Poly30]|uniref:Uncharacterized protein n=1 Tax=Saltatorellus ferox TaxID=2528018 RepID=A0A518F163_9BACT|nr:hypothetical protein Poly30_56210 [Planctomycetes bacterium Poly30]